MELFRYLDKGQDLSDALDIYDMVYSPRMMWRAHKEYGRKVDQLDVINDVFHQVYTRYSSKKGRVENFTNATLSTIDKSKYEFEVGNSESIERKMDKAQYGNSRLVGELPSIRKSNYEIVNDPVEKSKDLGDCIGVIEEPFMHNIGYFLTGEGKPNHIMPASILEEYELDTIVDSVEYLKNKYGKNLQTFMEMEEKATLKAGNPDCVEIHGDSTVELRSICADCAVITREQGYHAKNMFRVDIERLMNIIWRTFYAQGKGYIKGRKEYYLTLSGRIVEDEQSARDHVEVELIEALTGYTRYKVLDYEPTKYIIFSTTKVIPRKVVLPIFGKELRINLERLVAKEVQTDKKPFAK